MELFLHGQIACTLTSRNNMAGVLDDKLIARIVSLLSDRVDLLLEDAASKLNLKSLLLLIDELCHLCHMQLQRLDEENIG